MLSADVVSWHNDWHIEPLFLAQRRVLAALRTLPIEAAYGEVLRALRDICPATLVLLWRTEPEAHPTFLRLASFFTEQTQTFSSLLSVLSLQGGGATGVAIAGLSLLGGTPLAVRDLHSYPKQGLPSPYHPLALSLGLSFALALPLSRTAALEFLHTEPLELSIERRLTLLSSAEHLGDALRGGSQTESGIPPHFLRALRRAEERYRILVDDLRTVVFSSDGAGTWTFLSQAWEEATGFPVEESLGKNGLDYLHPEDGQKIIDMANRLRTSSEDTFRTVVRYRTITGAYHYFELFCRLLYDDAGEICGTSGTLTHIHDRVLAEQALQDSEARNRIIVEAAAEAILTLSEEGRITSANPAAARMFGYNPRELLGQDVATLIPTLHPDPQEERTPLVATPAGEGMDAWGHTRDGILIPLLLLISEVQVGDARTYVAVIQDLTQRRLVERHLMRAKEAAESANSAKSDFLARMSHEIRTPMNGVIGMTSLLLDTDLGAEQREYAETIRRSAQALLTVINDILDFSKIEAGKLVLEVVPFDFATIVDDVVELLHEGARQKGLRLGACIQGREYLQVAGDPGRLRQVLLNLVGNAIKFTDRGEVKIQITALPQGDKDILIEAQVRDTGIGISHEGQLRLFQSFTQVDGGSARRHGGTGLGLSICRQIVELMHGQIGVISHLGEGSTFWFSLPLARSAQLPPPKSPESIKPLSRPPSKPPASGSPTNKIRVLVAEDNAVNQRLVIRMLEKMGLRADVVADGQEAVTALHQVPYDLVLMDCQMPELDGFGATAQIRRRAEPGQKRIPIIAMTANAMSGDRERCLAAGMDDYLSKPLSAADLRTVLSRWLPKLV